MDFPLNLKLKKPQKTKQYYQMNPRNGFAVPLCQWVFDWKFQCARGLFCAFREVFDWKIFKVL